MIESGGFVGFGKILALKQQNRNNYAQRRVKKKEQYAEFEGAFELALACALAPAVSFGPISYEFPYKFRRPFQKRLDVLWDNSRNRTKIHLFNSAPFSYILDNGQRITVYWLNSQFKTMPADEYQPIDLPKIPDDHFNWSIAEIPYDSMLRTKFHDPGPEAPAVEQGPLQRSANTPIKEASPELVLLEKYFPPAVQKPAPPIYVSSFTVIPPDAIPEDFTEDGDYNPLRAEFRPVKPKQPRASLGKSPRIEHPLPPPRRLDK